MEETRREKLAGELAQAGTSVHALSACTVLSVQLSRPTSNSQKSQERMFNINR